MPTELLPEEINLNINGDDLVPIDPKEIGALPPEPPARVICIIGTDLMPSDRPITMILYVFIQELKET